MNLILKIVFLTIATFISVTAYAVDDNQIIVCTTSCTKSEAENMAISNRYARASEISIINDDDWNVYTFRVIDASEPGMTIIDSYEISTPIDVTDTLNEIKAFENHLYSLSQYSMLDANIQSISPQSFIAAKPDIKEIKLFIPSTKSPSVTGLYDDVGKLADTMTYIRSKAAIQPTTPSIWDRIFSQTKGFIVIAVFDDASTINFQITAPFDFTNTWKKVDSTAMKDGKHYDHYGINKYIAGDQTLDIEYMDAVGNVVFRITETKVCENYTKISSDGYTWSGEICFYSYAH